MASGGIESSFGRERGPRSKPNKQEADSENEESDGKRGEKASKQKGDHFWALPISEKGCSSKRFG
jgi:hypothetical protein